MKKHHKAIVKVKGTPIEIGGEQLVMPPLNLLHLEQFHESFKSFDGNTMDKSNITFFIDAVTAALQRNYPEITREEIGESVGLESMQEILLALVATSGLTHRAGEAAVLGEAQANATQS